MADRHSQLEKDSIENYIHSMRLKMGQNIRETREKRGYSQDKLAEIMGVNRTTISKIENGKFSFSVDYLAKFSFFLNFDVTLIEEKVIS